MLVKLDGSTGATLWVRLLEGADEQNPTGAPFDPGWGGIRHRGLDFDAQGNVLVTTWNFPSAAVTRSCEFCPYLLTYDSDGNLLSTTSLEAFTTGCNRSDQALLYRVSVAPDDTLWGIGWGGFTPGDAFGQVTRFSSDASQAIWSHCDLTGNELAETEDLPQDRLPPRHVDGFVHRTHSAPA